MTIYQVIAKATKRATVQHLLAQNEQDIDCDKLTQALRSTLKVAIAELQEEFKMMNDAMMSEQQLRWAVNVQANALAAKAITAYRAN